MPKSVEAFCLICLLTVPAAGQVAVTEVNQLVDQLYAYAAQYRAKLPSLTCDEVITSQMAHNGAVRKQVRIESRLEERRVVAAGKPDEFVERHQFQLVDGKPAPAKVNIPYFVQGGFANALGFLVEKQRGCFTYRLEKHTDGTRELEITLRADVTDAACAEVPGSYHKTASIDGAGHVTHVERSISAADAKSRKEVDFAAMDFGPQSLGSETLWLPLRMTAHDAKNEGSMTATYSSYHRFAATTTVLPASVTPSEP